MLSRLGRIVVIVALLLAGAWLVARGTGPAPESLARVEAIQMAAPGPHIGSSSEGQVPELAVVSPTVVDLRTIPAGVYDPNNQLDRWKRGEIDLSENESIRPEAEMQALREAAQKLAPSPNISIASSGPGTNAPAPAGASFESLSYPECCGGGGNVPPDPELAVGPNHVIAVVNVAFEIYNKSGTTLKPPTTFASFMASNPNCTGVFDPNVLYDEESDRYILGIDADGFYYCVAVSQTGDPTGNWNLYAFPTASGADFFDYPHAGVGRDAIYMGANIFAGSFKESRIWAFNKANMYAGQPATSAMKVLPNTEDTPQPLNLHGFQQNTWPTSGPHYFFTDFNFNGSTYSVWSWANPFSGGGTLSKVGTVNINAFTGVTAGMPVNVPQNGSGLMQANDFRPQDFEYRNGFAWSVMTVSCNPGSGVVDCIQWVKVNPATATIVDGGVYSSAGQYRFFGDLAVNHCDDMAVGYTKSSTSMWPSVWYTGRKAGDPAGTLQAEAQLKAGEIAYTAFDPSPRRWGDYTEMTIAPDGTTFWYLGEYSKNTGTTSGRWGTWIGSFSFADCTTGGPTPTPSPTPPPGGTVHVGDLDASATSTSRSWTANVTVTVHNNNDAPVANATVSGNWSNGTTGSASCVTNASGQCVISKSSLSLSVSAVTLTVSNVTIAGQTYAAGDNHDPDGDSNGTSIVVNKTGTPPTPTPTATPGAATIHVGDLDGSGTSGTGGRWNAAVTVTVHDSSDTPVSGATVNGSWSSGASGNASCVTNASGQCTLTKSNLRSTVNSVTFGVTNVTKAGSTYNSGANHDPDADSNGTTIVVAKP